VVRGDVVEAAQARLAAEKTVSAVAVVGYHPLLRTSDHPDLRT
jgi:hypothetical protein